MNIPGLTDRFDLENLQDMSEEQLHDLEHVAMEKYTEIQMQLESIQQAGGVSRDHTAGFAEYLPEGIVVESFTGQVTHTNYDMSCEALSTAAKIALGLAVAAGLGALALVIKSMMGKGGSRKGAEETIDRYKKWRDIKFDVQNLNEADFINKITEWSKSKVNELINAGVTRMEFLAYMGDPSHAVGSAISSGFDDFIEKSEELFEKLIRADIDAIKKIGPSITVKDLPSSSSENMFSTFKLKSGLFGDFNPAPVDWYKTFDKNSPAYRDQTSQDFSMAALDGYEALLKTPISNSDLSGDTPVKRALEEGASFRPDVVGDHTMQYTLTQLTGWIKKAGKLDGALSKLLREVEKADHDVKNLKVDNTNVADKVKSNINAFTRELRYARKLMEMADIETSYAVKGFAKWMSDNTARYKEVYDILKKRLTDPNLNDESKRIFERSIAAIKEDMSKVK